MPKRTTDFRQDLLADLADPEEASHYLNAALSDSEQMALVALRDVAEARQMAKVAKEAGVAREALYRMRQSHAWQSRCNSEKCWLETIGCADREGREAFPGCPGGLTDKTSAEIGSYLHGESKKELAVRRVAQSAGIRTGQGVRLKPEPLNFVLSAGHRSNMIGYATAHRRSDSHDLRSPGC